MTDPKVAVAPMRWWHIPAVLVLERELFGDESWSAAAFWSELANPDTRHYVVALRPAPEAGADHAALLQADRDVASGESGAESGVTPRSAQAGAAQAEAAAGKPAHGEAGDGDAGDGDAGGGDAGGGDAGDGDAGDGGAAQGGVVGYAGLAAYDGEAHVLTLGVAVAEQRRGVGTVLLRDLLAAAERAGARQVFLDVRADNPVAQRLYARHGFVPIGVRRGYYQPSGTDAVVMQRDAAAPIARRERG